MAGCTSGTIRWAIRNTGTTVSASAEAALPLQADGDIVGALPATMTVGEAPLVFC